MFISQKGSLFIAVGNKLTKWHRLSRFRNNCATIIQDEALILLETRVQFAIKTCLFSMQLIFFCYNQKVTEFNEAEDVFECMLFVAMARE